MFSLLPVLKSSDLSSGFPVRDFLLLPLFQDSHKQHKVLTGQPEWKTLLLGSLEEFIERISRLLIAFCH
jgi:hypothetical protein